MRAQQVTALLLCTLLSSTLAHEYLRASRLGASQGSSKLISPFQERAAKDQTCVYVCNSTVTDGLQLYINVTAELIAIYNKTEHVALVIDINANIIGLFNGTSGDLILINLKTQTGLYIKGSESQETWHSSNGCFKSYFYSLTSLKFFFTLNVGTSFSIKTISQAILVVIARLFVSISSSLSIRIQYNLTIALELLIRYSTTIVTLFSGSLKGFLAFATTAAIQLRGDFVWLVGVFEGLGAIFGSISGGLAALIKAKVQFDLAVLFAAANGLELFINVLLAIVVRVNLSQLGGLLTNIEAIFAVFVKLGGNAYHGVTGLFNVVYHLILLIHGKIEILTLLEVLVRFAAYRQGSTEVIDIDIYIAGLLEVVSIQNSTHGSSSEIVAFNAFLLHLRAGTLIVGGINISNIIKVLSVAVSNALELIVRFIIQIAVVVKFGVAISALVIYFIRLLTSAEGVAVLRRLIPGLSISVSAGGSGNFLYSILKSLNLTVIWKLLTGGVWELLVAIPPVKAIIVALSAAIKVSSNGQYNLQTILSGNASFGAQIKAFIQAVIKGGGSVTWDGGSHATATAAVNTTATATAAPPATATKSSTWSYTWRWSIG